MPPIMFEDSQPQPKGVRLGDLKERDTYLPYPCSPLSKLAEVTRHWRGGITTIVRELSTGNGDASDSNTIVYPVSVKMVRADAPGCDATKQIVEDAQALRAELEKVKEDRDCWRKQSYENGRKFGAETNARVDLRSRLFKLSAEYDQFKAELEDARKVAAVSERYATAFQDDLKAAKTELAQVTDARNVWMGAAQDHKADADKLRAELAAVTTHRDHWIKEHDRVKEGLDLFRNALQESDGYRQRWLDLYNESLSKLTAITTERDAWKARAEAYSRSVVQKCGDTFRTHSEDELCFLYADHATRYYEQDHRIPPAPKESNANA